MMRAAPLTLLLVGCLEGRPQSKPWYAEVVTTGGIAIADARYDSKGTLHLFGVQAGGDLFHGTLDDDTRTVDWSPPLSFIVDGTPYEPDTVQSTLQYDRFDLAIRPGTDDVWLWLDGLAGRVSEDGRVEVTVQHPAGDRVYQGSVAFRDADTLILSQEGGQAPRTVRLGLSGDAPAGEPAPLMDALFSNGGTGELPSICGSDVAGGVLHYQRCTEATAGTYDFASATTVRPEEASDDDTYVNASAMAGAADDWVLGRGLDVATCIGERAPGGGSRVSTKKYEYEGNCWGVDAAIPPYRDGDVREDGNQFAVFFGNGLTLLYDRKAPPTVEKNLDGTWCNGLTAPFTIGGDLPPNTGNDPVLFGDIDHSVKSDKLILHYADGLGVGLMDTKPFKVEHWAVRAGDTLHMKSYTHHKYESDGAGLSTFGGLHQLCE